MADDYNDYLKARWESMNAQPTLMQQLSGLFSGGRADQPNTYHPEMPKAAPGGADDPVFAFREAQRAASGSPWGSLIGDASEGTHNFSAPAAAAAPQLPTYDSYSIPVKPMAGPPAALASLQALQGPMSRSPMSDPASAGPGAGSAWSDLVGPMTPVDGSGVEVIPIPGTNSKLLKTPGGSSMAGFGGGDLAKKEQEKFDEMQGAQRAGIDDMRQYLDKLEAKGPQVNLQPLAGLIDSWTGSKLSGSYKAPQSADERAMDVLKLKNLITSGQAKLSETEMQYLRTKLNDKNQYRLLSEMNKANRANDTETRLMEKDMRTDVDKSVVTPYQESVSEIDQLRNQLSTGSYRQVMASLSKISRMTGEKGVLTDQDVVRVLPKNFQSDIARFKAYFSNTADAKIAPEYVKSLTDIVDAYAQKAGRLYSKRLEQKRKSFRSLKSTGKLFADDESGPGDRYFAIQKQVFNPDDAREPQNIGFGPTSGGLPGGDDPIGAFLKGKK